MYVHHVPGYTVKGYGPIITPNCNMHLLKATPIPFLHGLLAPDSDLIYTVTREVNKTVTINNTSTMYGSLATISEEETVQVSYAVVPTLPSTMYDDLPTVIPKVRYKALREKITR